MWSGLNHLVISVESMDATISGLAAQGIDADEPGAADDSPDIRTRWITDPDGNRIELVPWPAGHPDGLTAADWPDEASPSERDPR
jgi:lactoylglutathione lyase